MSQVHCCCRTDEEGPLRPLGLLLGRGGVCERAPGVFGFIPPHCTRWKKGIPTKAQEILVGRVVLGARHGGQTSGPSGV